MNQQLEDTPSMKFTWKIQNFSRLNTKRLYSNIFTVGGYTWRILIFPKGNNVDHLSVYLDVADSATLPYGWSRYAQFSLAVVNQIHSRYSIRKDTQHQFKARESDWGFTSFMPLGELYDPSRGYIVNDTIIIEAEVVTRTVTATPVASEDGAGVQKSAKKPDACKKLSPSTTLRMETASQTETKQPIEEEEEESKQEDTFKEEDRIEEPEEEATDATPSKKSSFLPQPKDSIAESNSIATETQLTPQKSQTLNNDVEVLDEDFEKEIFARLELLTDLPTKEEPVTPVKGKAMMKTETKDAIEIPTQEEINLATSIIQSFLKGNPSEVCQELDQKEILDAAQTLSRVPSLPASDCQFWTDFPSILQDFSQQFNDKQKIVAEAMTAQKKIEDGATTLIHKREEYLKTKAEHALQSKEYQDLLSERSQIEARLAELRNLIPEKKSTVDVLTSTRSKLLKELDVEGKQLMAEKKQAAGLAEAAKLAAEDVQQLEKVWESWRDLLH